MVLVVAQVVVLVIAGVLEGLVERALLVVVLVLVLCYSCYPSRAWARQPGLPPRPTPIVRLEGWPRHRPQTPSAE